MTPICGRPLAIVGHGTAGPFYEMPKAGESIFVGSDGRPWAAPTETNHGTIEELLTALERVLPYFNPEEGNADIDFARAILAKHTGEQS